MRSLPNGVQANCRSQSRGKTWSIGWAGDVLSDYQAADSAEGVPRLRYPPCRESASAAAVAVPLRFLTELHVSAHTRKLDPMFTVVLVERGQGILTDRHGQHETRAGDVVIFEPGAEFRYTPVRPQQISMMIVDEALVLDMMSWRYAPRSAAGRARIRAIGSTSRHPVMVLHPSSAQSRRLRRLLHAALELQAQHDPDGTDLIPRLLTIFAQLTETLDPLIRSDHPDPQFAPQVRAAADLIFPDVKHSGVRRALEFIAAQPANEWSLESLAKQASLSSGYFSRVFTAEIGIPPRQFLSQRRLDEFVVLVQTTTLTVTQAARMVGWSSSSHAIAAFRSHFGETPHRYRHGPTRDNDDSIIRPDETPIPPPGVEPQRP